MLTAVDFDHQSVLVAGEIDDVRPDRTLVAKLVSRQAPIAQSRPHPSLGIGR
jgi:hypothetical protein